MAQESENREVQDLVPFLLQMPADWSFADYDELLTVVLEVAGGTHTFIWT